MSRKEAIDFLDRDQKNINTARDLYWTLDKLGFFTAHNRKYTKEMLGPLGYYWAHKLEPHRDHMLEYILDKSR